MRSRLRYMARTFNGVHVVQDWRNQGAVVREFPTLGEAITYASRLEGAR